MIQTVLEYLQNWYVIIVPNTKTCYVYLYAYVQRTSLNKAIFKKAIIGYVLPGSSRCVGVGSFPIPGKIIEFINQFTIVYFKTYVCRFCQT